MKFKIGDKVVVEGEFWEVVEVPPLKNIGLFSDHYAIRDLRLTDNYPHDGLAPEDEMRLLTPLDKLL